MCLLEPSIEGLKIDYIYTLSLVQVKTMEAKIYKQELLQDTTTQPKLGNTHPSTPGLGTRHYVIVTSLQQREGKEERLTLSSFEPLKLSAKIFRLLIASLLMMKTMKVL